MASIGVDGTGFAPTATRALEILLGDRFTTARAVRDQYGRGESYPHLLSPDAAAFPVSTEEVGRIAAICHAHRIPMVPSGAGTSLEGHITAPLGGLGINLSRMDRIVAVNEADLDCVVEAGVTREQLNQHLRASGLFFPIDPGANASLGGMASTRASGTNAVRYGTMAHNVLGLTVIQPDGRMIRTGGRARKSAAGYDLTRLYVGSEGTLGIITEVRLRLYGMAETMVAATCAFDTLAGAVESVIQLVQIGVPVARVELLDDAQVRACNLYSGLAMPEKPHLFFEFHGSKLATQEQAETAQAIASEHGGSGFEWAVATEDRNRLWKARHNAYFASVALRPGAEVWTSDVCVPVSHLADAVLAVRADIDRNGLVAPIVGHVGDGNFHVLFAIDPADPSERDRAETVYAAMIDRAIAVGGSCTGEHGIGMVKRKHLIAEHGADAVETMRLLKQALDPLALMNPGKIFL
ncbi:FAD-linked oxidase C-terminal domain-containing protein [Sphingobium sp. Sx8-8]|uniref:FAD-binding oxidoreductase n=1 Tax=Sphingobium sp. Sx8-8 TaxID=2933617 RepID=UPI001F598120|nr:FAD-linked oxidase C-terminal domain-containing protein [Sphingobium sp. Sx8-8]